MSKIACSFARKHAKTHHPCRCRHSANACCKSSDCVMPWVAAAILKSRLNSAETRKLRATVSASSGLARLRRVYVRSGGSPFGSERRGGGGGVVGTLRQPLGSVWHRQGRQYSA